MVEPSDSTNKEEEEDRIADEGNLRKLVGNPLAVLSKMNLLAVRHEREDEAASRDLREICSQFSLSNPTRKTQHRSRPHFHNYSTRFFFFDPTPKIQCLSNEFLGFSAHDLHNWTQNHCSSQFEF